MRKKLIIKRTGTIRRKAYHHRREPILSGDYRPKERLYEITISDKIGASRTRVREALHSLEMEGLVECLPKVGYAVKTIPAKVAKGSEATALMEGLTIRWAFGKAKGRLIADLQQNMALSEAKVAPGRARAFLDLDSQIYTFREHEAAPKECYPDKSSDRPGIEETSDEGTIKVLTEAYHG